MTPQSHMKFSAADIERYHQGTMLPAEMHALEKAALEDPFLADAIEGYIHIKTPAADIALLKQKVQQRSNNVIPLNSKRRLLLSLAAILILLVGFGWLAYQFSTDDKRDLAVQSEAAPTLKQAPPANADSITNVPQETSTSKTATPPTSDEAFEKRPSKKAAPVSQETAVQSDQKATNQNAGADAQTFSNPHIAAAPTRNTKTNIAARSLAANTFQAQVVDEQNQSVPFATITILPSKNVTKTDAAGNFSVTAPDSAIAIRVQASGYREQRDTLTAMPNAMIVMQRGKSSLPEVAASESEKRRGHVQLEAVKPLIGWKRFQLYVEQHIAEVAQTHTETGEVVLSFNVSKEGRAIDITIEKALCDTCDATAVRLIQQGSKWKKTNKESRARARVRF